MPEPSMRSLATVAWGMILVVADFRINDLDLIPDPVGWVLVAVGAWSLVRTADQAFPAAKTWFALVAAAAVVALLPALLDWVGVSSRILNLLAGAAEVVVMISMCTGLMAALPARRASAKAVRTAAVVTAVAGVAVTYAASVEPVFVPLAVLTVVAVLAVVVWFLVLLFGAAKDPVPRAA